MRPSGYKYDEKDDPFKALDCLLGNYYQEQGMNEYFGRDGNGRFAQFIYDQELNKFGLSLDSELGLDCRSHECVYTEFDPRFPMDRDIKSAIESEDNELTREDVIFYVLQHCHLKHAVPRRQDLLKIIEERKKIKIAPPRSANNNVPYRLGQSRKKKLPIEAAGNVIEIHTENEFMKYVFNEEVKTLIVVDFAATWCPYSKRYDPKYEQLAREYGNKVTLLKVTTDKQADGGAWCGGWQQTNAVPEFQFWKNCQLLDSFSGAREEQIRSNSAIYARNLHGRFAVKACR